MEIPGPLRGESRAIREVRDKLQRAASTDFPVLIQGESGTGKQAAAEWLHALSSRHSEPFIEANCACWNNSTMVHSHLFGHEKGAYTGATHRHPGVFERANGGTLFLDEIGELGLEVQSMLLKAIDQGRIEPLGSITPKRVQVRLVAATNRDLEREVAAGRFRLDLLARLSPLLVRMPPLRERHEDLDTLWQGLCTHRKLRIPLRPELRERIGHHDNRENLRALERWLIQESVWGGE